MMNELLTVLLDIYLAEEGLKNYSRTKKKWSLTLTLIGIVLITLIVNVLSNFQNFGMEMIVSFVISFLVLGVLIGIPYILAARKGTRG